MWPLWPERATAPIRWWAQTLGVGVAMIWGLLFALTAVFAHRGGASKALDVALGSGDPYQVHGAAAEAVALGIISWLLVPAIVGTVAALIVQTLLLRARPYSREDWTTQLDGLRDEFEAFKEEQAKQEQAKQEQAKPPSEPQGG